MLRIHRTILKNNPFLITLKYPRDLYFPPFQMFSRCNIIQNRWFKKVTPFTIEKRIEVKIFTIPAHFSISQPSKPNPSTFLVKTFSDTRSPRSSANRPNSSKLPPPDFIHFIHLASATGRTDNRTCREDKTVDWSTAVRNGAGKRMESIYF